jgi:NAD(P)H-dependent flavin oxidoreductase YrpB (nitropropane dioxygenase family)
MSLQTRFCGLVGCRWPIVQTGMGWVSGPRLTAATCNAGGFGILAATTMTLEQLSLAIDEVSSRTEASFGVNLRGDQPQGDEVVRLLIDRNVKLASFAGPPQRAWLDRLKKADILSMATIGARRHAEKMASWGVDVLIAQGGEGGGHTGKVATSILLPEVCEAVDIPVLGAGGFRDGRGLVAALAYGADGIAMGTRFLLTQESTVPEDVKAAYLATNSRGTVVTSAIDGHPQRVVLTPFVQRLLSAGRLSGLLRGAKQAVSFRSHTGASWVGYLREGISMKSTGDLTWSQLAMAANAPMLTKAALVAGDVDAGILPTGQVVGRIDALPTVAELIDDIVSEATMTLARLTGTASSAKEAS